MRERLEERLGVPVRCVNDGAAATLAEWRFGAARGCQDVVGLTLGTGLGAGVIIGGRPLLSRHLAAAVSFGHATIEVGGRTCLCGNIGCAETLVSANAVVGRMRDYVARKVPSTITDAYEREPGRITFRTLVEGVRGRRPRGHGDPGAVLPRPRGHHRHRHPRLRPRGRRAGRRTHGPGRALPAHGPGLRGPLRLPLPQGPHHPHPARRALRPRRGPGRGRPRHAGRRRPRGHARSSAATDARPERSTPWPSPAPSSATSPPRSWASSTPTSTSSSTAAGPSSSSRTSSSPTWTRPWPSWRPPRPWACAPSSMPCPPICGRDVLHAGRDRAAQRRPRHRAHRASTTSATTTTATGACASRPRRSPASSWPTSRRASTSSTTPVPSSSAHRTVPAS